MKLGWQLKEEAPLFILVLIVVTGLMWYMGYPVQPSIGTGFLFAAVITSFEVIIDAAGHKQAEKLSMAARKATSKPKKKTRKKKATSKKKKSKKTKKKKTVKKKGKKKTTRKRKK